MIRFGSFQIDPRTWLLTSDSEPIDLSPRLVEILGFIVRTPGRDRHEGRIPREVLAGRQVTENTLTRAIADIRKAIGEDAAAPRYLETASRRGYRFVGEKASMSAASDPFQDWVKGRLALDSLDSAQVSTMLCARSNGRQWNCHATRPRTPGSRTPICCNTSGPDSVSVPDRDLLVRAMESARQASTLDPSLGEAWAVLGYLLSRKRED